MKRKKRSRPPRLILFGTWAEENLGDDLLLVSEIRQLRRCWPDAELILFTGHPGITRELLDREKVSAERIVFHYNGRRGLREPGRSGASTCRWIVQEFRYLCGADLLLIGPGNQIQDVTRRYRLLFWLLRAWVAWLVRTPFAIVGISFYSLTNRFNRWMLRFLANRAAFVSTRDHASVADFIQLGVRTDRLYGLADLSFSYDWREPPPVQPSGAVPIIGLTARVFLEPIFPKAVTERYEQAYAALLRYIHGESSAEFRFFPFYRGSQNHDGVARDHLLSWIDERGFPLETVPVADVLSVRQEMARCDAFIGVRYHSVLMAVQVGIPVLAIGYARKTCRFMREHGLGDGCVPVEDATENRLIAAWERLMADRDGVRMRSETACRNASRMADRHFALIRKMVEEGRVR